MGKIKAIPVREFMGIDRLEMLRGYRSTNHILFEDNKVCEVKSSEMIMNRYLWELILLIPELPIKSEYNISNYYSNNIFTSKSINKVFEVIFKDMIQNILIPGNNLSFRDQLYERMYQILNLIYNEVVYYNLNFSSSMNILDLLEIQLDPELIKAMQKVSNEETPDSIEESYKILDKIMYSDERIKSSPLARSYISGQINANQAKQVLASRGYVSEMDGSIFKKPLATSFTLGMNSMYDISAESRSAAKALFLADKAIQDSEYFARELQLVCMEVEQVDDCDCGNTEYLEWYVRSGEENVSGKSDLNNLVGKYYKMPKSEECGFIKSTDTHLIGKTILIRSVLHCKHNNKHKICKACYGELFYSIHEHTNIGHISAATLTQKFTQSILSTKHLTGTATSTTISLDATADKFFIIKDNDGYAFKKGIINKDVNINLIVSQSNAFGLKDIISGKNMLKFDPARISRIESFILSIEKNGKTEYYPIVVKDGSKKGSFTYKFLEYIVQVGYTLDARDRYVINLNKWKSNLPILKLPQIEFSYIVLASQVKSMLKSVKTVKGEYSIETRESLLQKIFDTVNSKLEVNIAVIEVIVYAFTVVSLKERDYRLGRFCDNPQMAGIMDVVSNRSLGSGYAYQRVPKQIADPRSFSDQKRSDHLLDTLVKPNETILDYYGSLTSTEIIK